MKKIYTIEALKFGFQSIAKNPVFFLLAFLVSKLIWAVGLLVSFLISLPYFIHLIEFVSRIFYQIKDLIFSFGLFGNILGGVTKPFGLFTNINAGPLGIVKEVAGKSPVGGLVKGVGKVVGAGAKLAGAMAEIKAILQEIMQNKFLFLFFFVGVIVFIVCAKLTYDFIMIGWTRLSLDFYNNRTGSIKSLISTPQTLITYSIATLVFFLISAVPSLIYFWFYLLISYFVTVPYFIAYIGYVVAFVYSWYLILKLWFYPYYIVGQGAGSIESLQKSYSLKLGFVNVMVSLIILSLVVGIPAAIVLVLPNVVTIAILGFVFAVTWMASWMAYAFLYRKLRV